VYLDAAFEAIMGPTPVLPLRRVRRSISDKLVKQRYGIVISPPMPPPPAADLIPAVRQRFTTKRIVDPEDDDLSALWVIHQARFKDEVADSLSDLRQWIADCEGELVSYRDDLVDDIMLALKDEGRVCGYCYVQHFLRTRYAFVGYLVVDKEMTVPSRDAESGTITLLKAVFDALDANGPPWKALVGEFDTERTRNVARDRALFSVFGFHEGRYAQARYPNSALAMLDVEYEQPILEPKDDKPGSSLHSGLRQTLVYYSRDQSELTTEGGNSRQLPLEEAKSLFLSLFTQWYGQAHEGSRKYQKYVRALFDQQIAGLTGPVAFLDGH